MKKSLLLIIVGLFYACQSPHQLNLPLVYPEKTVLPITSFDQVDTIQIAKDAFTFGLPLVLMELTKKRLTNFVVPSQAGAPINSFSNKHGFPDSTSTDVVRPNVDTYYSIAFLDLSDEPLVLSIPATDSNYYMLPMLDAYTNVFASPGIRTNFTAGGNYLIAKAHQNIPPGIDTSNIDGHFESPTNMVWILGRFQVNDPNTDGRKVQLLQRDLDLTPISEWGTQSSFARKNAREARRKVAIKRKRNASVGNIIKDSILAIAPNTIVQNMPIGEFFARMNKLMKENPPPTADSTALEEFKKIGIGLDPLMVPFNARSFSKITWNAFERIPEMQLAKYLALSNLSTPVNGWTGSVDTIMGNYGTAYLMRAIIAYIGLGANEVQDAVYLTSMVDTAGNAYSGVNNYRFTFAKGETPPVNAFWSLTLYDEAGVLVGNPIGRYALGHGTPPLQYAADSSLTIYIQEEAPDPSLQSNWLPAPSDGFNLLFRAYWPKESVLDGQWFPPGVIIHKE